MPPGKVTLQQKGDLKKIRTIIAIAIAIALIILLIIWEIQQTILLASPDSSLFIGLGWIIIAFLAYIYGIDPIASFLNPQRLWNFIIVNYAGIPIFSRGYSRKIEAEDSMIFAGIFHTSNTVLKYQLNSEMSLDIITLADRAILVKTISTGGNNLHFCLVIDHISFQFEIILEEIIDRIIRSEKFQKIRDFNSPTLDFDFVNPILTDLFMVKNGGK